MKRELKKYLAEIGAKGGKASRRKITPDQQAAMQEGRKAARLRKTPQDSARGRNAQAHTRAGAQDSAETTDSQTKNEL